MKHLPILLLIVFSCQQAPEPFDIPDWVPYDESEAIAANAEHENERLRYKLIQSRLSNKNDLWAVMEPQLAGFSADQYEELKPLILEQDIPTIQGHIASGTLTYERLVQWYLYRIALFENDPTKTLHTLVAVNPDAVAMAQAADDNQNDSNHPLFGMPILLKDNVNAQGMPTTAGAHALSKNYGPDAFIVKRLREKGAIILGKVNLSEWANFNCLGCPNGFSAMGGQTLNPYGRGEHDTGGSSAGSGTSMAANYAVAAVGTETSGSILSPSSSNSVVGLKPTVGLLSRMGIVPISSTLDTPGPMTRNVTDNAIVLDALSGSDPSDPASKKAPKSTTYLGLLDEPASLDGLRMGVWDQFLEDSLYHLAVHQLEEMGVELVPVEAPEVNLQGFGLLLQGDMLTDLSNYFESYTGPEIAVRSVADVLKNNLEDSARRIPYGHGRIARILDTTYTEAGMADLRNRILSEGRRYFSEPMEAQKLDGFLSINNWSAGYAAAAHFPCLTVPMGYQKDGRPMGLTFITGPWQERTLLQWGYAFEQATRARKMPDGFN